MKNFFRNLALGAGALFLGFTASLPFLPSLDAQINNPGVQQHGSVTTNHCVTWFGLNSIQDSGGTCASLSPVQSVFGRVGTVVAAINDYAFSQISGQATLAQLPSLATNTALVNATNGSAVPTAFAMPSCSATTGALGWLTNTGFQCQSVTPAFSSVTGQATLAQLPTIADQTVLGNITGAPAVPAALTVSQIKTMLAYTFANLSGQATLAQFPNMAANTALVNATNGSAVPTAFAMPSCSATAGALGWLTNTGFQCQTVTPAFSSVTGQATLAQFPNMDANTALVNATSGSAVPTAFAMPSCSGTTDALEWTTSTGFTCRTLAAGGDVTGPGSATDTAIAIYNGTGGKTIKNSVVTVDASGNIAGSPKLSKTGGINIQGTNTNDAAPTGYIGEIASATKASGSAVSVTTDTSTDIISVSLTAGDWDVEGWCWLVEAGSTLMTIEQCWISSTSATRPTPPTEAFVQHQEAPPAGNQIGLATGRIMLSLSGTTTVYLSTRVSFSISTLTAYGKITARRSANGGAH